MSHHVADPDIRHEEDQSNMYHNRQSHVYFFVGGAKVYKPKLVFGHFPTGHFPPNLPPDE